MAYIKVHLSDIQLILSLHAEKDHATLIFDPFGRLIEDVPERTPPSLNESTSLVLINLSEEITSFKRMSLEEFDLIIDFGSSVLPSTHTQKSFDYINKTDGTMRWIYSRKNLKSVLNFFNTSSRRSKIIAGLTKVCHAMKLGRVIKSGAFVMSRSNTSRLERAIDAVDYDNYTIFTGTAGYDRTAVISLEKNGVPTHFVKMALNDRGMELLSNERIQLTKMNRQDLEYIIVPKALPTTDQAFLIVTNESSKADSARGELGMAQANALVELAAGSLKSYPFHDTEFWDIIHRNILCIEAYDNSGRYIKIVERLKRLRKQIDPSTRTLFTLAHSDFTPWNMKITSDNKLYLYDWELARETTPALFDLFHFHFQNGIMIKGQQFDEIMNEINISCSEIKIKSFIERHQIDMALHLRLYLLRTLSYYVATFCMQESLSKEQVDQLAIWTEALGRKEIISTSQSYREIFIQDLRSVLSSTVHALIKFESPSIGELPSSSDIDIAIQKGSVSTITRFCKQHGLVQRTKLDRRSFMSTMQLFFKDGSFLSLDFINQFKRKEIQMLNMNSFLQSARENSHGLRRPALKFDLEYALLFYGLNGADIPEKYRAFFSEIPASELEEILNEFNTKYAIDLNAFDQLFTDVHSMSKTLYTAIKNEKGYSLWQQMIDSLNYYVDTLRSFFHGRGFVMTLSGVDGVGKSTILERVKSEMESRYRKEVVLLRHRPRVLPILSSLRHGGASKAEQIASVTIPRQGSNKNVLSSTLRFAYYYLDYLIGQVYVYFKYIIRGKVVLYDRYYFDFINDARRSNINVNKGIARLLYTFIWKPKLNILLWADSEEVFKRKQEVQPATISRLTQDYKQLFKRFDQQYTQSTYRAIENARIDDTVSQIMHEFNLVA